ncbi:MAG: hypothetical protein ABI583_00860 [Betaproteobacteria bacterium]
MTAQYFSSPPFLSTMGARVRRLMVRLLVAVVSLSAFSGFAADTAAEAAKAVTFAQLESAGAVIREIHIHPQNIFDLDQPNENNWLFRTANKLHLVTRPSVIEQSLLFKRGERVSVQKIDETERLLRNNRFIYDVEIRPVANPDGSVDIEVNTRDTWTIDLVGNLSRSGGNNKTSFGLKEYNLLGTGLRVGFSKVADEDRRGTEFEVAYPLAFDGRTNIAYSQGQFNDGRRRSATVVRPFFSLDTRWAAGANWNEEDRIDSIYNAGNTVGQYRHSQDAAEIFGGWSPGLIDGKTQRFLIGSRLRDDTYFVEPGRTRPSMLPVSRDARAVFLRYEVVEDRFVKLRNRDQIGRPEFFRLGFFSQLQLTRDLESLGSTRSAWLYSAFVSNGFSFAANRDLLLSGTLERRVATTGLPMTQIGASARIYLPQNRNALFYASLAADSISGGGVADQLLLGGNSGMRGYPSYYQAGERRALLSLEQRAYTDWYPFRLVRVGGAVFFDYGRAWGGPNQNLSNPGWLADAGVGLRLALDRAAFSNVLHADIAVPLNRTKDIKSTQFVVRTEVTF